VSEYRDFFLRHRTIIYSEKLIRTQAKLMVDGGYLAAGYEYIIIDDCWLDHTRAAVSQSFEEKKYRNRFLCNRMVHYNQILPVFQVEFVH
jgi:hypothetical protein